MDGILLACSSSFHSCLDTLDVKPSYCHPQCVILEFDDISLYVSIFFGGRGVIVVSFIMVME